MLPHMAFPCLSINTGEQSPNTAMLRTRPRALAYTNLEVQPLLESELLYIILHELKLLEISR
jgi:hypothetical protein